MDVTFFTSAIELRRWFEENHDKARELWVGFYKKDSGKVGVTYPEAVDAALCYGWIDGIRKSIDETSYTNRFTPRKARSNWSAVNIKRVRELIEQGLMQPSGLKAFNELDEARSGQYSYEERTRNLDDAFVRQFQENSAAWVFFEAQPPSYRKTASWWVMSAKREDTRVRRLAALIAASEKSERLGVVTGTSDAKNS